MIATPSAAETIRATVFVAEATPDFAAGTAPTTASVAGAMIQPIDRASPKNHATSPRVLVSGSKNAVRDRRTERPVGPPARRRAEPSQTTPFPAGPAPIISPSAIGLMTAPALIA